MYARTHENIDRLYPVGVCVRAFIREISLAMRIIRAGARAAVARERREETTPITIFLLLYRSIPYIGD